MARNHWALVSLREASKRCAGGKGEGRRRKGGGGLNGEGERGGAEQEEERSGYQWVVVPNARRSGDAQPSRTLKFA